MWGLVNLRGKALWKSEALEKVKAKGKEWRKENYCTTVEQVL
jgi:acyl-CoA-binding protein